MDGSWLFAKHHWMTYQYAFSLGLAISFFCMKSFFLCLILMKSILSSITFCCTWDYVFSKQKMMGDDLFFFCCINLSFWKQIWNKDNIVALAGVSGHMIHALPLVKWWISFVMQCTCTVSYCYTVCWMPFFFFDRSLQVTMPLIYKFINIGSILF